MEIEDIKVDGVDMAVFSFLLALRGLRAIFHFTCSGSCALYKYVCPSSVMGSLLILLSI